MNKNLKFIILACTTLSLGACGLDDHSHAHHEEHSHNENSTQNSKVVENSSPSKNTQTTINAIIDRFDQASFVDSPKQVECTLSGGTKTECISFTLKPQPATMPIGPWCPRNISDGADKSGIWLEDGKVHDADGDFIANLETFYKDEIWQMFDEKTGKINVTDSKVSCSAAARPDVDEQYQNFCVECQVSYMDSDASTTYIIPISPVKANSASSDTRSGVGIAYSGVRIDSSAPTHAILAAHTLAPFDDCGGHVNLHVGYHLHAITDADNCLKEINSNVNHEAAIGLAMDGYPIHRQTDTGDLDSCGGHESDDFGYHYHAAEPGANKILACHRGETGCSNSDSTASCDASKLSSKRGGPRGNRPERPKK